MNSSESSESRVAAVILREYFGPSTEAVAKTLLEHGKLPLRQTVAYSGVPGKEVKRSLMCLLQHQLLQVTVHPVRSFLEYDLRHDHVIRILRFPRYVLLSKQLCNETLAPVSEFIMMEILKEGRLTVGSLVMTFKSLPISDITLFDLESAFQNLYRKRMIAVANDFRADLQFNPSNEYSSPETMRESGISNLFKEASPIKLKSEERSEPPAKRSRRSSGSAENRSFKTYFQVDYDKADQLIRDDFIAQSLRNRFCDETVVTVAQSLLRLASTNTEPLSVTSAHVSIQSIARELVTIEETEVNSCLSVLSEETGLAVTPVERLAGGGTYCIDLLKMMTMIVESTVASVIECKLGGKCARVFRILLSHKSLPQKVVEENAMMPPKECKEIIFTLVKEGFVKTDYYPRTQEYAPAKTYFMFSIDLEQVVRNLMQSCCHAIANAIRRRCHEYESNRLLIERKLHIDQQIDQLQQQQQESWEQQIDDLKSTFTTHDNNVVTAVEKASQKLHLSEIQVEETHFILNCWLQLKLYSEKIKD